ncbi:hypothetical protein BCT30_20685 [Enterovibrio norvegicus]|uniref:DUF3833 domain-containing protein n=1 Tax=Enterovibrio norvegicus TaxID=188144 RepID=UPI000319D210|nr:DUF3833 domain-containing protein [Enterovibrio norvegicus]MCC4798697.1 DUF3833 domain-containing protein [Enterovibrio norvegicus]OEE62017.1 hypothetical protein A1OS_18815 [Enterovibrio norvegicus]PMH67867.1 hypothetical protein BCU62_07220 [Enterovibrio norvegicus]PMI28822.1 hypothetical protein BCU47_20810 [Enterovibrio norvegicus]PMI36849.1 hypothetical protein BCU46_12715 [Enterovibrio norvegicus]
MKIFALFSAIFFGLVGCSSSIDDYKATTPAFNLFEYFDGDVKAWGMVQDYTGMETRRFEVMIKGTVEGNQLILDEDFDFSDGEKQNRVWTITQNADGSYQGTAGDVVGIATGREEGNALNWAYDLSVDVGESNYVLTLDDWLYRQDDKRVFNLTSMKKFGIEVGRITIFFEKQ